jgi:predicted deacylase
VRRANVNSRVKKGEIIAEIMDPYTGEIADRIIAPQNGIVFFHVNQPLIYSQTPLFRIIPTDDLV